MSPPRRLLAPALSLAALSAAGGALNGGYNQISSEIYPSGKMMCWAVRNGRTRHHNKIVLERCNDGDDAQLFLMDDFLSGEERERMYDEATVKDTCPDVCDIGDWYTIHPKLRPEMIVVGVREPREKAWLRLEYPDMDNIDMETQVFYDLEDGSLGLGDGKCICDACLFVTTQGINADIGDPVMLRMGKEMLRFARHGSAITWWYPFGSR